MNLFETGVAHYFGDQRLSRIQAIHVGIAGAGGLGSNCAMNLVRSGFRQFTIIDFDQVEWSNLNRQFFFCAQVGQPKITMLKKNLEAINPDLDLTLHQCRLTPENIHDLLGPCDVVIEAFDDVQDKKLVIDSFITSGKLLISASGIAGWGDSDAIATHQLGPRFYLIGDLTTEASDAYPPVSSRVMIAAAKQADVVLEYVLGKHVIEKE